MDVESSIKHFSTCSYAFGFSFLLLWGFFSLETTSNPIMWNRSIFSSVFDALQRNVFCASALPNSKLITDSQVYVYRMLNQRFIPAEKHEMCIRDTLARPKTGFKSLHITDGRTTRAFSSRSRAPMSMKQRIFTYSSSVNGSTHTQEREIKNFKFIRSNRRYNDDDEELLLLLLFARWVWTIRNAIWLCHP